MSMFKAAVAVEVRQEAEELNELRNNILKIIEDDQVRTQFTPDYWQLEQHKSRLLFIHDDMAQTQPHHDMVKEGSLSGFYPFNYGYTAKNFQYLKKNLGLKSIPIALDLRDRDNLPVFQTQAARIRGEVYAVRPRTFLMLDTHRQNGVQFKRTPVTINIPTTKVRRHTTTDSKGRSFIEYSLAKEEMVSVTAFMYIGREEYWKDQLHAEAGFFDFTAVDIMEEDRIWLKKYYQYSRVR